MGRRSAFAFVAFWGRCGVEITRAGGEIPECRAGLGGGSASWEGNARGYCGGRCRDGGEGFQVPVPRDGCTPICDCRVALCPVWLPYVESSSA